MLSNMRKDAPASPRTCNDAGAHFRPTGTQAPNMAALLFTKHNSGIHCVQRQIISQSIFRFSPLLSKTAPAVIWEKKNAAILGACVRLTGAWRALSERVRRPVGHLD